MLFFGKGLKITLLNNYYMEKSLLPKDPVAESALAELDIDNDINSVQTNDSQINMENEEVFERDYSKEDLVDLIDQPEWKTILIDLVKNEKMNPWDINVSELAEKYLKKINELGHSNLRVPANAILACAILLKTKSKYLKLSSIEDDEPEEITEQQKELLLEEIPDLMANRSFREGKISLDELVASIEDIIDSTKPKKNSLREIPRMELKLEDFSIEDMLDDVLSLIQNKVDSQGIVLFKDLVSEDKETTLVETFLAVLFLMTKGKIHAYQTDFFGDIFVQLIKDGTIIIEPEFDSEQN